MPIKTAHSGMRILGNSFSQDITNIPLPLVTENSTHPFLQQQYLSMSKKEHFHPKSSVII